MKCSQDDADGGSLPLIALRSVANTTDYELRAMVRSVTTAAAAGRVDAQAVKPAEFRLSMWLARGWAGQVELASFAVNAPRLE